MGIENHFFRIFAIL